MVVATVVIHQLTFPAQADSLRLEIIRLVTILMSRVHVSKSQPPDSSMIQQLS